MHWELKSIRVMESSKIIEVITEETLLRGLKKLFYRFQIIDSLLYYYSSFIFQKQKTKKQKEKEKATTMNKKTSLHLFALIIFTTTALFNAIEGVPTPKVYCKVTPHTQEQQICRIVLDQEFCHVAISSKLVNLCRVVTRNKQ